MKLQHRYLGYSMCFTGPACSKSWTEKHGRTNSLFSAYHWRETNYLRCISFAGFFRLMSGETNVNG